MNLYQPPIRAIIEQVASKHGLIASDLLRPGRPTKRVTLPKQEAYWAAITLTGKHVTVIARVFQRDPTTITYGAKKHQERIGAELGQN